MATENPDHHELEPEDAERLTQLSEEIRSRLTEVAYIFARVTGEEFTGKVGKFVPREAVEVDAPADDMEIWEFLGIDGCTGSIDGHVFIQWPCGFAGAAG